MLDVIRVAAAVPNVVVADVARNKAEIMKAAEKADKNGADIVSFPELCLTGYTCGDLFFQQTLLDSAKSALAELAKFTGKLGCITVTGLPIELNGRLFNCAAVTGGGRVLGIVPKTYIPNYNEFYEHRWFSSGAESEDTILSPEELGLDPTHPAVPFGRDLVFDAGDFRFGIEICEDLWATVPPSGRLSLCGAELIVNPSASNETISKRKYRRELIKKQSAGCLAAYLYASAGGTESTTDLIFSGHSVICENGRILAENEKTIDSDYLIFADVDMGKLRSDRRKIKTFADGARLSGLGGCRRVVLPLSKRAENDLRYYKTDKLPFVPDTEKDRTERCAEIFEMQVAGLKKRLDVTGAAPVIGVSGGLDSTLALLVCTEAVKRSGGDVSRVTGITMPCFGTTDRTHNNSVELMRTLGVTAVEIPIGEAVRQHFRDIGHDGVTTDLTYENSQARERTQVLMDYAGRIGGLVVGTGDLSELALGWCTYNADHMSMYGVNCGVPKTLVRWMIDSLVKSNIFSESNEVLKDILDTPISPELLPPDAEGKIAQQTEEIVGPYALHDFFLYNTVRYGFTPEKVFRLASRAFGEDFEPAVIKKWLIVFYRRFFTQQFKRSCLPDGVKIGSICLSPRGDWRMPSDASAAEWIKRAEQLSVK